MAIIEIASDEKTGHKMTSVLNSEYAISKCNETKTRH